MKLEGSSLNCQIPCLQLIAEGAAEPPPESISRRIKLAIRRRFSPDRERTFKNFSNQLINTVNQFSGRETKPVAAPADFSSARFNSGDWVQVRTLEEIQSTLNHWQQFKGCTFMPEMVEYCGTKQKVLKVMGRFVDERDLRIKRTTGIILLEGIMCQGTADFGSCDRSCFYFWREEWLEKMDRQPT